MNEKAKCIVIESDSAKDYEDTMNKLLNDGYRIESSSCNSKLYKAILILDEKQRMKNDNKLIRHIFSRAN